VVRGGVAVLGAACLVCDCGLCGAVAAVCYCGGVWMHAAGGEYVDDGCVVACLAGRLHADHMLVHW